MTNRVAYALAAEELEAAPEHTRDRPRAHAPARARAALESPQRHRRRLLRCRPGRRKPALRRTLRGGTPSQRRPCRPPPPVRQRPGRRQPTRRQRGSASRGTRGARPPAHRHVRGVARDPLQRVVPGSPHRYRCSRPRGRARLGCGRAGRARVRGRRGRARRRRRPARLRRLRAGRSASGPPATCAPGSSSARPSSHRPSSCSTGCSKPRWNRTRALPALHSAQRPSRGCESPRGATICALERSGDRIGRLHLRTGSYANWPVLARVVPGELLPDFPLINKSFELCYACADR